MKTADKNNSDFNLATNPISTPKGVLLLSLATLFAGLCAWMGDIRYSPPRPRPDTVSEDVFSAERAEPILRMLVGDGVPHPSGSEHNKVVRNRIIDYLSDIDISVEQHATSNRDRRTDEEIHLVNLIARIPGSDSTGTIALASHYDTKFSTPGASDDAVGVAVSLEIARYFSKRQPKNDLVFLFTDGEEMGLLGAEKFMSEHPLAKQIDVIINLEARGTSGPSLMFETGNASHWSIRHFAAASDRPFTSSLFYEIYKLLPNDTDFSRFREGNLQGFNFAFIGDVRNYHTPLDNFETVDRGSFQHHGDNAFELMKLLADEQPLKIEPGRAVYFDLFGLRVFYWPQWMAIPLAIFPLGIFLAAVFHRRRINEFRRTILVCIAYFAVAIGMGVLLNWAMNIDGQFENPWPYNPLPRELPFWLVAGSLAGCTSYFLDDIPQIVLCLIWLGWTSLLLLISIVGAGASYLFLVPSLFAALGLVFSRYSPITGALISWIGVCLIWLPMEPLYYDALGFRLNAFLVVRVALVSSALLPIIAIAGRKASYVFAAICGSTAFVCLLIGKFGW